MGEFGAEVVAFVSCKLVTNLSLAFHGATRVATMVRLARAQQTLQLLQLRQLCSELFHLIFELIYIGEFLLQSLKLLHFFLGLFHLLRQTIA